MQLVTISHSIVSFMNCLLLQFLFLSCVLHSHVKWGGGVKRRRKEAKNRIKDAEMTVERKGKSVCAPCFRL